jgi:rubrerythrin
MSYVEQRLLVAIREALEEEIDQQEKYAQRAQEAKEPEMKSLFLFLLEEEKKHEALLSSEFERVKAQLGNKILSDLE